MTNKAKPNLIQSVFMFRMVLRDSAMDTAEHDGVPFTPIWWWWNGDADEYIMTLWDTEAGRDPSDPPMYSFGTSDPTGTFGRPAKLLVPPSLRNAARKLLNNK